MKRMLLIISLVLLLNLSLAGAITQQEINEAKSLTDSNVSCDTLTDEQLEILGEYYMEQMHPGESHELMHKMMGLEEGSEAEEQFHITMAKTLYCGETNTAGFGGMMGMMNSIGGGMMGNYPLGYSYANGYWNIFGILLFIAVIFLIVWIMYRFGIKKTASEIPLNILKKRFAKGEITKKKFEDMKKEIGK